MNFLIPTIKYTLFYRSKIFVKMRISTISIILGETIENIIQRSIQLYTRTNWIIRGAEKLADR